MSIVYSQCAKAECQNESTEVEIGLKCEENTELWQRLKHCGRAHAPLSSSQEDMGSRPAGYWTFSLFTYHPERVTQGGASLSVRKVENVQMCSLGQNRL